MKKRKTIMKASSALPTQKTNFGVPLPRLSSNSALYESSICSISAVTISPSETISCPALTKP